MTRVFFTGADKIAIPMYLTRRVLFSALLVLSAIPLLLAPTVSSQSYTTITSWTTETGQVTSTSYSTFAAATTTQTSTATSTYNYTFTLPPYSQYCYYDYVNGTFDSGTRLVGKVVTSTVMDFYVMSRAQFLQFTHEYCNQEHHAYVTARNVISSYSLDWVVPASGEYEFVFSNFAPIGGSNQVIGNFTLQYPYTQSFALTLSTTMSQPTIFAITETASSVYSTQVQTMPLGGNMIYIAVLVLAVVLVLVVIALRRRRPSAPTVSTTPPRMELPKPTEARPSPPSPPAGSSKVCIYCGATIPAVVVFCTKCGKKQE